MAGCSARSADRLPAAGRRAGAARPRATPGFSSRGACCGSALLASGGAGRRRRRRSRSTGPIGPADAVDVAAATASRRSSSPSSAGCTRSASSSRALLMALFYIGGELAQSRLGLPSALTGVLPGPAAVLPARRATRSSHYRLRWRARAARGLRRPDGRAAPPSIAATHRTPARRCCWRRSASLDQRAQPASSTSASRA
ncbi:MAG: hypothetical protein MZW92_56585 [Comamonadaceae bacterium]|nr:hypothetical protein [Comamonadaceae bacterium]